MNPTDDAAVVRRMLLIGGVALGGGALMLALGIGLGERTCFGAAIIFYLFGHPILIEEDLRRRGQPTAGCFSLILVSMAPPAGTCFYLISAYREKAVVLIPLYIGLISSSLLLGWGVGWLIAR